MFKKITFLFILIFLVTACEGSHQKIETSLVPRSILLSNPDRFCASMNHTGDKISYLARKGNEVELCIEDFSGNIIKKFDVKDCAGTYNHQWSFTGDHILICQDNNGDENDHVICLNIKTGASKDLTPFKARSNIAGLSKKHPHEILVISNKRDPKWFDIYSINIITGKTDLVLKNNEYISFYFDNDFKLRIASKMMPDGSIEDYLINNGKREFFRKVCFDDTKNTSFMYFNANDQVVYGTDSIGRDKSAFFAYDLQNKTSKVLFESNLADVQLFTYDPNTLTPQCICVNYLNQEIFVMDKAISKDIAYLKSQSHSKNFDIIRNLNDDTWLIMYHSSNSCKKYYLYKRDPQKCEPISLKFLFSTKPSIDKYKLQEKLLSK